MLLTIRAAPFHTKLAFWALAVCLKPHMTDRASCSMVTLRVVEAYCTTCEEIRDHTVMDDDPGSCKCNQCGAVQALVHPIDEP